MTSIAYALVPNAARTAMLVADGRLPAIESESNQRVELIRRQRKALGYDAIFLRTAARQPRGEGSFSVVVEFDAAPPEWSPRPPLAWVPLEDAAASSLVPPQLAAGVEVWLEEQRGAPVDRRRSPWARPGWLGEAVSWVAARTEVRGPAQLVRQWPLSAVYRFETDAGPVYLKAAFSLFSQEPAVTAALAHLFPGLVPDVVAIDKERGWLLMREFGSELAGDDHSSWGSVFETASAIQRSLVGRTDELLSLGAPPRGLESLVEEAKTTVVRAAIDRLAGYGIPETLVHGDLHPWNAVVENGRIRIIDWSDAAVGHPFVDSAAGLFFVKDDAERAALLDAYVAPWSDVLPQDALRDAAALAEVAGCVYQAISYREIAAALEPADRGLFGNAYADWLERAANLGKALQPG